MSSVISSILCQAPPPAEIVAVFAPGHAEFAYFCGGKWYKPDHQPLGWEPISWHKTIRLVATEAATRRTGSR